MTQTREFTGGRGWITGGRSWIAAGRGLIISGRGLIASEQGDRTKDRNRDLTLRPCVSHCPTDSGQRSEGVRNQALDCREEKT